MFEPTCCTVGTNSKVRYYENVTKLHAVFIKWLYPLLPEVASEIFHEVYILIFLSILLATFCWQRFWGLPWWQSKSFHYKGHYIIDFSCTRLCFKPTWVILNQFLKFVRWVLLFYPIATIGGFKIHIVCFFLAGDLSQLAALWDGKSNYYYFFLFNCKHEGIGAVSSWRAFEKLALLGKSQFWKSAVYIVLWTHWIWFFLYGVSTLIKTGGCLHNTLYWSPNWIIQIYV